MATPSLFTSVLALSILLAALSSCGETSHAVDGEHGDAGIHIAGDLHVAGRLILREGAQLGATKHGDAGSHVLAQGPGEHVDTHWSYEKDDGPEHWGSLDAAWKVCGEGRSQSPIDFVGADVSNLNPVDFSYRTIPLRIKNNGHTLQVDTEGSGGVLFGTKEYALIQFHFHSPSEHRIDGKAFPMVAHLVHKSADGELLVVGVPLEGGEKNMTLETIWRHFPRETSATKFHDNVVFSVDALLPVDRSYYMYIGSLTEPPCAEGVRWVFLRSPVSISQRQIAVFKRAFPKSVRPVQPINGRTVGQGR
ncbi:MAG: carbonic anhydrase family protein [Nannocystaceae bacterium]